MIETYVVSDIFDYFPGNHGLTEEVIYSQKPASIDDSIAIFSGSSNNEQPLGHIKQGAKNKDGDPIQYFTGPCIILTKDGSAGLLTYKPPNTRFTINHHACVLKVKKEWAEKIQCEWFVLQYQTLFNQVVTSRSDNRIFSTEWLDRLRVNLPSYEKVQIPQLERKRYLLDILARFQSFRGQIELLLDGAMASPNNIPTTKAIISKVFDIRGGNSGLTAEVIYNNPPVKGDDPLPVVTGATLEENLMGKVSSTLKLPNGKKPKTFDGECILLTRNGFYAGTMFHHLSGKFVPNDHVYILTPRPVWLGRVNMKWFIHQYSRLVRATVTSRSDNATFNKGWLDRLTVDIPEIGCQDIAANRIGYLEATSKYIHVLEQKLFALAHQAIALPTEG